MLPAMPLYELGQHLKPELIAPSLLLRRDLTPRSFEAIPAEKMADVRSECIFHHAKEVQQQRKFRQEKVWAHCLMFNLDKLTGILDHICTLGLPCELSRQGFPWQAHVHLQPIV
jgi:hypothetical protein